MKHTYSLSGEMVSLLANFAKDTLTERYHDATCSAEVHKIIEKAEELGLTHLANEFREQWEEDKATAIEIMKEAKEDEARIAGYQQQIHDLIIKSFNGK